MFGISLGEIALIVVLFIILVPPEDVPKILAHLWHYFTGLKDMADSFADKIARNELIASILDADHVADDSTNSKEREGKEWTAPSGLPSRGGHHHTVVDYVSDNGKVLGKRRHRT